MEVSGKIIAVLPLQQGTSKAGNAWQSQSYVLETQEQYPKKICFEVFGEERIKNNLCQIDDLVTVSFDLESREFNGRWYTSVRAWKVSKGITSENQNTTNVAPANVPANNVVPNANTQVFDATNSMDDDSGLPF